MEKIVRQPISREQQLRVWTCDNWTCRYCGDPVFFPPAFFTLKRHFQQGGYYHPNWKESEAPVLIRKGASVDHVVAVTRGGTHEESNFVTACWTCNLSKSNEEGWQLRPRIETQWDGLLAVFLGLACQAPEPMEKEWLRAIEKVRAETMAPEVS